MGKRTSGVVERKSSPNVETREVLNLERPEAEPVAVPPRRLAAIDIGSNSVRLVVVQHLHGHQFQTIDEERHGTRLARHLGSSGELDPEAVEQTLEVLKQFKKIADGFQVTRLETIATCAVREATNSELFVTRVAKEIGLKVKIISAVQEGRLAFRSVNSAFDLREQNLAVADIGGGSTEIVLACGSHVEQTICTNLGAVRMTELYSESQPLFPDEHEHLIASIAREVARQVKKLPFKPQTLYGTGGTFTSLASMLIARRGEDAHALWGYRVTHADVRHTLEQIRRLNPKQRRMLPGLGADRADIIVAGIAIVDQLMSRMKCNLLRVHTGGVRDGLLLSMMDKLSSKREALPDVRKAIEALAASCGVDLPHARHTAQLATQIWDGLRQSSLGDPAEFDPEDRRILEFAGLLQDVGYLIDYRSHHKHSYQLILNSRLPGVPRHELALIANVARYHRGKRPKRKHANFRHLAPKDQTRVRRLAAILRIAGGLDRGRTQRVERIRVTVQADRVLLSLTSRDDPELELWATRGRADVFAREFGLPLAVTVDVPENAK